MDGFDLKHKLKKLGGRNKRLPSKLHYQMYIDKDVNMGLVKSVERKLMGEVYKVAYSIIPEEAIYDKQYYKNYVYKTYFSNLMWNFVRREDLEKKYDHYIAAKQFESGVYEVNDEIVGKKDLAETLRTEIVKSDDYLIDLEINNEANFGSYLRFKLTLEEVIHNLRNDYALATYGEQYDIDMMSIEKQRKIVTKYPIRFIESR